MKKFAVIILVGLIILLAVFHNCSRGHSILGQNSTYELVPLQIEPEKSLYVLSGQSNSWGVGQISALSTPAYAGWNRYNFQNFSNISFHFFEAFDWRKDKPDFQPLNKLVLRPRSESMEMLASKFSGQHGYYLDGEEIGSEVGLASALLDSEPKVNHTIYKQAYPGGPIKIFLDSYRESGGLKSDGNQFWKSIFANLKNNITDLDQQHLFFIWYQGESDANAAAASDYLFNLGLLMDTVTSDLTSQYPKAVIWKIIIQLHSEASASPQTDWKKIQAQQMGYVQNGKGDAVLFINDLPVAADGNHLNAEGQLALGECTQQVTQLLKTQSVPLPKDQRIYHCAIFEKDGVRHGAAINAAN